MFSKRLKELRKNKNITQIDLANALGVTAGAVGLWETGKRLPDIETVLKIAKFFNVSTDYLMDDSHENQIIIIGKDGDFKSFSLNEKDLETIANLANSLQNIKID